MIPTSKDKKTLPGVDEEDCDFVACNERLPQFSYKNVTLLSERNMNNSGNLSLLSASEKSNLGGRGSLTLSLKEHKDKKNNSIINSRDQRKSH